MAEKSNTYDDKSCKIPPEGEERKMRMRDIPKPEEFERLRRENPLEYHRLYQASMKTLDRATTRLSYVAIIISAISILLTLIRWLLTRQ